jgi:hypothetical protein
MIRLHATLAMVMALAGAPALAQVQAANVNPLTGTSLGFEQKQKHLEELKLDTLMLEEQAKQAELRGRLDLAPMKKRSEERRLQSDGPAFPPYHATGTPPVRATAAGGAKGGQTAAPPAVTAVAVPATSPGPAVVAILKSGEKRLAVVSVEGQTYTVSEGHKIRGQEVSSITAEGVTLGGQILKIERRPAVIAVVDRQPAPSPPGTSSVPPPGPVLPPLAPLAESMPAGGDGYSGAVPRGAPLPGALPMR